MLSFNSMFAVAVLVVCPWWFHFCAKIENCGDGEQKFPPRGKRLMAKTGCTKKGCCDAHTEAIIEILLASATGDFIGHWDDCDIRKDAAANHFDFMTVGFNPQVQWSAGFRSVSIWCQVLFLWVAFFAARRFYTKNPSFLLLVNPVSYNLTVCPHAYNKINVKLKLNVTKCGKSNSNSCCLILAYSAAWLELLCFCLLHSELPFGFLVDNQLWRLRLLIFLSRKHPWTYEFERNPVLLFAVLKKFEGDWLV